MKRTISFIMGLVLCLGMTLSVSAASSETTEIVTESSEIGAIPRAVSIDEDFSIKTGKSWSTSFDMTKWFADDHNAFKIIISDVSGGSYKVILEGEDGYSFTSNEHTDDCTVTAINAKSKVTYTVYIVNTGSGTVSGNVKISSYYN